MDVDRIKSPTKPMPPNQHPQTALNLAQLNIAAMRESIDSPLMAEFVANIDRINGVAESAPGFVWRLKNDPPENPFGARTLVNLSVWRDVETLADYVHRSAHVEIMRRRHEWFTRIAEASMVLWWVPAGHEPSVREAAERLDLVRRNGPGPSAFTFAARFEAFEARVDDLTSPQVQDLVVEHLRGMHSHSPPEHVNALAIDGLQRPEVTFWSVWNGQALCGCGALKELDSVTGEIKSMRARAAYLRHGVGQFVLDAIIQTARHRGYRRLYLETGTGQAFNAAHALYRKNGFEWCGAFGDYNATEFNVFMVRNL